MIPKDKIICGDTLEVIRQWPDECIDCVVTSPPYWGVRNYQVNDQIGLEATYQEYIEKLIQIFDEVKRILKPTGTCWVNIGDRHNSHVGNPYLVGSDRIRCLLKLSGTQLYVSNPIAKGLLPDKTLVLLPFRFAIEMVNRGWILRNDIIWYKPSAMPESVKDRCTKAHEYVFFFTKRPHYSSNFLAIRELSVNSESYTGKRRRNPRLIQPVDVLGKEVDDPRKRVGKKYPKRNRRDVWSIVPKKEPYQKGHFATFPEELVRLCILAGCPAEVCKACGQPVKLVVRPSVDYAKKLGNWDKKQTRETRLTQGFRTPDKRYAVTADYQVVGREIVCNCEAGFEAGLALDPFVGSGTVAIVAKKLGYHYIGIDLNEKYCESVRKTLNNIEPFMF